MTHLAPPLALTLIGVLWALITRLLAASVRRAEMRDYVDDRVGWRESRGRPLENRTKALFAPVSGPINTSGSTSGSWGGYVTRREETAG
jgi:hypothetical protein